MERMSRDDAFTEYVRARGQALRRTAVHMCAGNQAAADDLLQNTLVRAYLAWSRVRHEGARDAYVRQIMARLSYRSERRVISMWPGHAIPPAEHDLVERDAIWSYLTTLPSRQRVVMVLRYYEDLSEREIAEVLGCSTGTVKTHASRALASLRARMADTDQEGAVHEN